MRHASVHAVVLFAALLGPSALEGLERAEAQPRAASGIEPDTRTEPERELADVCPPPVPEEGEEDREDSECPPAPEPIRGSDDVADAPLPEDAGGILIPAERPGEYLWIGRAVLFVPKLAIELAFLAPRLALYAYDRYDMKRRYYDIFFTDDRRTGIYPSVFFETGVGLNAGVRFVHSSDSGAAVNARAGFGLDRRIDVLASVTAPTFARGRGAYGIRARFRDRPSRRFYGLGNRDRLPDDDLDPLDPLDPNVGDLGFSSRYSYQELGSEVFLGFRATRNLRLELASRLTHRDFGEPRGTSRPSITEAYDTAELAGFDSESFHSFTDARFVLDFQRAATRYISLAAPSSGPRLAGHVGYQAGFYDDPSNFVAWGLGIHYLIDLFRGDRVLLLGVRVDGATGNLEDIPFRDLPALGGKRLLRGYPRGRFRDRYAAVATAEYRYPIVRRASAYLFVDGGTVWRELVDPSFDNFRVGFGGGLQAHTETLFLTRVQVGSSIDGGVEFVFTLDAPWGTAPGRSDR